MLNRDSIERITMLLTAEFAGVSFKAQDGIWEVYDEPRTEFLAAVLSHRRLDSFEAWALLEDSAYDVTLSFNASEAEMRCNMPPEAQTRLEHIIHDVRKCLIRPSLSQRVALLARDGRWSAAASLLSAVARLSLDTVVTSTAGPYSQIVLEKETPNPLWENVKANILSNVIWALLGAVALFFTQWAAKKFGWVPFWQ